MTTNDLQSLIDAEARRIAAFNDSEHTWQDCPEEPAHRKGRYCVHQVVALARHLVANKHPVQQGRIESARLTDDEIGDAIALAGFSAHTRVQWRAIADAATAKAVEALLDFDAKRHKALVEALGALLRLVEQGKYRQQDVEAAQAALALTKEAPHAQ